MRPVRVYPWSMPWHVCSERISTTRPPEARDSESHWKLRPEISRTASSLLETSSSGEKMRKLDGFLQGVLALGEHEQIQDGCSRLCDLSEELAHSFHTTRLPFILRNRELAPFRHLQRLIPCIRDLAHPQPLFSLRHDLQYAVRWCTGGGVEKFGGAVGGKPFLEGGEFGGVGFGGGERDLVGVEGAFDEFAVDLLWATPSLCVEISIYSKGRYG